MSKNAQHAAVLGVKVTAKLSEIKAAYYQKARLYHPDKVGASKDSHERMVLVNRAYEALSEFAKACETNGYPSHADVDETDKPFQGHRETDESYQGHREWRTFDEVEIMLKSSVRRAEHCMEELTSMTGGKFACHGDWLDQDLLGVTYDAAESCRADAADRLVIMTQLKEAKRSWERRKLVYDIIDDSISIYEKIVIILFELEMLKRMAELRR